MSDKIQLAYYKINLMNFTYQFLIKDLLLLNLDQFESAAFIDMSTILQVS